MEHAAGQRHDLVLASGSPRRMEILGQLGLRFSVVVSGVDEPEPEGQGPEEYARGLSRQKVDVVARRLAAEGSQAFVLGADTIVVVDGAVLNKPLDAADAARMLRRLQGRRHEVITAVALRRAGEDRMHSIAVSSRVEFRVLDEPTMLRYSASGEGSDKAGAYAVQGLGAGLVRAIEGSYSNVVGLPACETLELLMEAGVIEAWP
jgi:septum formation protein